MAPRLSPEAPVKESADTKPRYHLHLTARFAFYDEKGTHMWREWPAGAIVTDPNDIALLEARGAPVEKIETLELKND
jgi:hypothetical protein